MNAIVNTGPSRLAWQELPTPEPGPGQVRIRTAACGICATDLEMIRGWQRTGFPSIPGHEWSGRVDAVGPGVEAGLAGTFCVAENVWADGGEVGFEHPGGYAEFLLTEARHVQPLPAGFPADVATLIEPLAVCVRARRRLRVAQEPGALIFGDGPIGLILLLLLRHAGVGAVAVAGGREERLRLARELGAVTTVNSLAAGPAAASAVRDIMPPECPLVVEASGSAQALETALAVAPKGSRILVLGDYGDNRASHRWNHLLHNELELIGSNASAGAWPEGVRLAPQLKDDLARLITHRLPAARFAEGIEWMHRRGEGTLKVVLEWPRG
jgi:threonine dehydrogenase-like Zn-dependent dehydrogenase